MILVIFETYFIYMKHTHEENYYMDILMEKSKHTL